jgi:hypothetical protein
VCFSWRSHVFKKILAVHGMTGDLAASAQGPSRGPSEPSHMPDVRSECRPKKTNIAKVRRL